MARKGDAPDQMDTEQDTTTKRRHQRRRTPPQQQAQPNDQQAQQDRRHEGQQERRREGEPGWQPSTGYLGDGPTDTGSEVDLQTASREELEALAFELDIDAFESMNREELVSEIEERS